MQDIFLEHSEHMDPSPKVDVLPYSLLYNDLVIGAVILEMGDWD